MKNVFNIFLSLKILRNMFEIIFDENSTPRLIFYPGGQVFVIWNGNQVLLWAG